MAKGQSRTFAHQRTGAAVTRLLATSQRCTRHERHSRLQRLTVAAFGRAATLAPNPLAPHAGHHAPRAKSVIWLFINGGPSHVDTWDYKPELERRHNQELVGFDQNTGFFRDQVGPIMRSPFRFRRHGQSGTWVSELFPNMARHVDKMALLYSCWTDSNNHAPALLKVNSGMTRMGFP